MPWVTSQELDFRITAGLSRFRMKWGLFSPSGMGVLRMNLTHTRDRVHLSGRLMACRA
jgi:hypothetical protein